MGGLLANLPGLYFLFAHFEQFWFGNLIYPSLNTAFYEEIGNTIAMTTETKLIYLWYRILRHHNEILILIMLGIGLVIYLFHNYKNSYRYHSHVLFTLLCLVSILIGCLAATPSQKQYYFMILPFMVLLILQLLSNIKGGKIQIALASIFLITTIISFLTYSPYTMRGHLHGLIQNPHTLEIFEFQDDVNALKQLSQNLNNRKILTLSPLYATNSGLPVYPEFTTGPFAWKTSHLVPEAIAKKQKLPLKNEIKEFIKLNKPAVIFTGQEEYQDRPIISVAKRLNYHPHALPSGNVIWLSTTSP